MKPLHAETHGCGAPLILLHGFTGSSAEWRPLRPLWPSGFRPIAVDLPGHGRSEAPPETERYRAGRVLVDLNAVLDRFRIERASVLGYSMGGRLALAFALTYPQRTTALVLEGASPGIADAAERAARRAADETLASRIEREGVESFLGFWMQQPLFASQAGLAPAVQEELRRSRSRNRAAGLAGSLRGFGAGAAEPVWERLCEIAVPTLLVVGEKDDKFRRLAAQMVERIPAAEIAVVPAAGHNTHLENPSAFAARVSEFLNSASAVRAEAGRHVG